MGKKIMGLPLPNIRNIYVYSKNCWVGLTQLWVEYGQTQPLG